MEKESTLSTLNSANERRWLERSFVQVAALTLLVFVAYWNSLDASFQFDDQGFMLSDPYVTSHSLGWEIFRLEQTRPLTYMTFHWNYLASGVNPQGYHWVNVLAHIGNALLVLLIARRHFSFPLPWLAAALFALHPLQTEAVTYIFQRATLLATVFALLSFLFFLRENYPWSVVAFGLSLLAKEETIALPAFLLLYDLVRRRPLRLGYYSALLGVAALAAARLFYVLSVVPNPTMGYNLARVPAFSYALTETRVVWRYLQLFLVPVGLNFDHDVPLSRGLFSPPTTLPALLGSAILIGGLAWLAWRRKAPALWLLGFFALLAPSSSIVPAVDVMFEHRTYFPLTCLVIAAAWFLVRLPRRLALFLVPALLVALLVGTIARNRVWHDQKSLWTDVMQRSPRKARAYLGLGVAYANEGNLPRARQLFEQGLALSDSYPQLYRNLGLLKMPQGDAVGALDHFRKAMALTGETAQGWNDMAAAYFQLGKKEKTVGCYRRALALDPCNIHARMNLMYLLAGLHQRREANLAGQLPPRCPSHPEQEHQLEMLRRALITTAAQP